MKTIALLLLCAALVFARTSAADELGERAGITRQVTTLFFAQDFAALEKLATQFRNEKSRTSSGLWKLTLFYYAFNSALPLETKDERFWTHADSLSENWARQYPHSPTAHIVRATVLKLHGWKYRGGGYASSVPRSAWPLYEKKVSDARAYLERHRVVAAADPQWFDLMAQIANEQSWDEPAFQALIDEGLKREPYYYQLYFTAVNYFTPKWGGNPERLEALADGAVRRTGDEGYGLYARIYWAASQYEFGPDLFSRTPVVWQKMKRGIRDVLARYPDQWNTNHFAYFACLAKDRDETRALIGKIKGAPLMDAWEAPQIFARCSDFAGFRAL